MERAKGATENARHNLFIQPNTPTQCFVPERGGEPLTKNPRMTEEYRTKLLEELGLEKGGTPYEEDKRYAHLSNAD